MKRTVDSNIAKFKRRWRNLEFLKIAFIALGFLVFIFLFTKSLVWTLLIFIVFSLILFVTMKPWRVTNEMVTRYLDNSISELEYSSWLLLDKNDNSNSVARLQKKRLLQSFDKKIASTKPPTNLKIPLIIFIVLCLLGYLVYHFNLNGKILNNSNNIPETKEIKFVPIDSTLNAYRVPKIIKQQLRVNYPGYTGLKSETTEDMNVKALEGSQITWFITFDTIVKNISINRHEIVDSLEFKDGRYTSTSVIEGSEFYNFKFTDVEGKTYLSELYGIESIKDVSPEISVSGVEEYQVYDFDQEKILNLSVMITDDYGLDDASIIATLSSGEGESVQFREERLNFEQEIQKGSRRANLKKSLNLDDLKMKPGDELYFYIQTRDLKRPKPNISRSETFFAVVKDTAQLREGVEGTLGADLMPDYFRSQRQLIIDTEKLISDKSKISEKEFKFRSNELGFDQKALRLKYGQFMGDENDSGIAIPDEAEITEKIENSNETEQKKDLLDDYTHKHDSEEHVENAGLEQEEDENNENKNPLHDYLHDHSDPEASTLFEKSVKAKMMDAMAQMWDSELHLRLYEPSKSLPFQYKALDLLQQIKNSARIYVHRIGFDPPPIKEETRLSGEIKNVGNFTKTEEFENQLPYQYIKQSISILEKLKFNEYSLSQQDKKVFNQAGEELAVFAVNDPLKYLNTLENLKFLSEGIIKSKEVISNVQNDLLKSIEDADYKAGKFPQYQSQLNDLFLNELSNND